jgi:hypothetical protein
MFKARHLVDDGRRLHVKHHFLPPSYCLHHLLPPPDRVHHVPPVVHLCLDAEPKDLAEGQQALVV